MRIVGMQGVGMHRLTLTPCRSPARAGTGRPAWQGQVPPFPMDLHDLR
ncbi:MAG: hypothetical protein KatS3mg058_3591 [Roseiflexus sp.]|nr:MAG: hypothetical protein KatS3mg058_3591 [Roseiflexus sp.]